MAWKQEKNQVVVDEIKDFRRILDDFQAGKLPETAFQKRRLWQGIYGQRQAGVQMIRIKIPYGVADTAMLRSVGEQARKRSNGVVHLTTRQAVQIHHIPRGQTADLIDQLADHGLTSREACGNTVRAITGDYLSGIGIDQVFDFRPVADRLFQHLLRNPYSQNFPRKFKISFSGSEADRGLSNLHDIGYIALEKDGVLGFRVVAGGGLGAQPVSAEVVDDFLPISHVLISATALARLFNAHGNRAQRMKARMKFVKEKWGIEKFREVYRGLHDELAGSEYGRSLLLDPDEMALRLPSETSSKDGLTVPGAPAEWVSDAVEPQIGKDLYAVRVKIVLGDIHADVLDKLLDLSDRHGSGDVRTTPDQNLVLAGIRRQELSKLYEGLLALGLADSRVERMSNVLACPGRSTCNLSLTSSKGLASEIAKVLDGRPELDAKGSSIKISGCPNSCGQHHIATIGFHGVGLRAGGGRSVPFAQLMLAGGAENGIRRMARRSVRVAARKAPQAVVKLLETWKAEGGTATLDDFLLNIPDARVKELLAPYSEVPSYENEPEAFKDWGETDDYNPAMGQGECAGGVTDLVNEALQDAENTLKMARELIRQSFWKDAVANAREAAAHVLRAGLSNAGEVSNGWTADLAVWEKFYGSNEALPGIPPTLLPGATNDVTESVARELVADAGAFVEAVTDVYRWKSDRFKPAAVVDAQEGGDRRIPLLDLRGLGANQAFVKVKLKLELLDGGQEVEALIDAGDPFRGVPASLRTEGHEITQLEPLGNAEHYSLIVRKGN